MSIFSIKSKSKKSGLSYNSKKSILSINGTAIKAAGIRTNKMGSIFASTRSMPDADFPILSDNEKKLLDRVGFSYDKKKKCWDLAVTTKISVQDPDMFTSDRLTEVAENKLKELKENIVRKLTSKIIIAELGKAKASK